MNLAATLRTEGIDPEPSADEIETESKPRAEHLGRKDKQTVAKDALSARLASVTRQRDRFRSIVPEGTTLNDFS